MTTAADTALAPEPVASPARRRTALAVLAVAMFVVVTTELLPVGLLPLISADLGVEQARVGLLVTVYAFAVGLMAAPLTARTSGWPRKRLFIVVCSVFALGTVLSGLALNYPMLVVARFLCGASHGVFFSIVAGYAAALADPGRAGRATAIVFGGNSAALVLGMPLGTVLGSAAGWRTAFCTVAGIGLVTLAVAVRVLPRTPDRAALRLADIPRVLRLPGLRPVVVTTALMILGHFTLYTYVSPLLEDEGGVSSGTLSTLLSVYGVAGLVSTWLSGLLVDRRPRLVMFGTAGVMAAALAALGLGVHLAPVAATAVALWGFAIGALPVSLQTAVLRLAGDTADAASSLYVAAFNIGIGGGALFGGLMLGPAGLAGLPWVALAVVLAATGVLWGARAVFSRR